LDKVVDRIYVGDNLDPHELRVSNSEQIGAILNVCETFDPALDVASLHMPFADCAPIPTYEFQTCMSWLEQQYRRSDRNIFIHCHLGISRSPTICASFMFLQKISPTIQEALATIKAARPIINPHPLTLQSAITYLEEMK